MSAYRLRRPSQCVWSRPTPRQLMSTYFGVPSPPAWRKFFPVNRQVIQAPLKARSEQYLIFDGKNFSRRVRQTPIYRQYILTLVRPVLTWDTGFTLIGIKHISTRPYSAIQILSHSRLKYPPKRRLSKTPRRIQNHWSRTSACSSELEHTWFRCLQQRLNMEAILVSVFPKGRNYLSRRNFSLNSANMLWEITHSHCHVRETRRFSNGGRC